MSARWVLASVLLLGVWAVGCERRVLPDHMYLPEAERRAKMRAEQEVDLAVKKVEPIGPSREWTADDGQSTIEGALIKVEDGRAYLLQENGQTAAIPLGKLSEADRRYAEETAGKGGGGEKP